MSCEIIANGRRYGCGSADACTQDKQIGVPKKRVVREDIPYRNGSFDFSAADGELYFEDRQLVYTFGVIGSEAEVHGQVSEIATWLYGIHDTDIWDSEIPYYHFHGSCDKVEVKYDETGLAADVVATFSAYPFMRADNFSESILRRGENHIRNKGRRVRLFASVERGTASITSCGLTQSVSGKVWTDLCIEEGWSTITLAGVEECTIYWQEERI